MTSIVTPPDIKWDAPETAILSAIKPDMDMLARAFGSIKKRIPLFMAHVLVPESNTDICIAGPFMGAPYSVMILETLVKWGVKNFVFLGWCGSISESLKIGSILLPDSAVIDEGVSCHYISDAGVSFPDSDLAGFLEKNAEDSGMKPFRGKIWTTDAPYMETPEKVVSFRNKGSLAVDMETSALFSAAFRRNVSLCSVLVVSDELYTLKWKTGFSDESFRTGRKKICDLVTGIYGAPV